MQDTIHPMKLRKRRRLSEVAYPGFKKVRMVKKVTYRDPTEWFLFLTTSSLILATVIGIVYSFVMIAEAM